MRGPVLASGSMSWSAIAPALERAREDAVSAYALGARAAPRGARRLAIGDPQAPLPAFLAILDSQGLLGDDGRLAPNVHLVSMGDHFDWGKREDRDSVARSGQALLAWLAAHPPEQVTLILGNHDLGRVGELADFDEVSFRAAQTEADAVAGGQGSAERFRERHPQLPAPELVSRDLSSFRPEQRRLVAELLRARRFCTALAPSPRLLLSHAGVTREDLAAAGLSGNAPIDAGAASQALNAALDHAVASWQDQTPLAIPALHRPGEAARGEGRGIFYHRPSHPDAGGRDLFEGPPRRRFDPRWLPPSMVQAIGHIGDRKCRELLRHWAPPVREATLGRLRHLRTNGRDVRYDVGVAEPRDSDEALLLFLDGTMARAEPRSYELLDLDTLCPASPC